MQLAVKIVYWTYIGAAVVIKLYLHLFSCMKRGHAHLGSWSITMDREKTEHSDDFKKTPTSIGQAGQATTPSGEASVQIVFWDQQYPWRDTVLDPKISSPPKMTKEPCVIFKWDKAQHFSQFCCYGLIPVIIDQVPINKSVHHNDYSITALLKMTTRWQSDRLHHWLTAAQLGSVCVQWYRGGEMNMTLFRASLKFFEEKLPGSH